MLHRNQLPVGIRNKSFQLGQAGQGLGFGNDAVGYFFKIFQCCGRILISAGEQQCIQLGLGCGDGNDLDYVFIIGILFHCRTAAHAVMLAHGGTHNKAVKQGRNQFRF